MLVIKYTAIIVLIFIIVNLTTAESDRINIYFFYGRDCHVCKDLMPVLINASNKYSEVDLKLLEVQYNKSNNDLLDDFAKGYGKQIDFVPAVFIGANTIEGYVGGHTEDRIDRIISDCIKNGCPDPIDFTVKKEDKPTDKVESLETIPSTDTTIPSITTTSVKEQVNNSTILCPIKAPCNNNDSQDNGKQIKDDSEDITSTTNTLIYPIIIILLLTIIGVKWWIKK